jgi:hypothetical protein
LFLVGYLGLCFLFQYFEVFDTRPKPTKDKLLQAFLIFLGELILALP